MTDEKLEMLRVLFPEECERIENGECPICGQAINTADFKNEINETEFEISGFCQACQDQIFNEDGGFFGYEEIPFTDLPEFEMMVIDLNDRAIHEEGDPDETT